MKPTEKEKFAAWKKEQAAKEKEVNTESWLSVLKDKKVAVIDAVNDSAAKQIFAIAFDYLRTTNYVTEYVHPTDLNLIKDCRTGKYFLELCEVPFIRAYENLIIKKPL